MPADNVDDILAKVWRDKLAGQQRVAEYIAMTANGSLVALVKQYPDIPNAYLEAIAGIAYLAAQLADRTNLITMMSRYPIDIDKLNATYNKLTKGIS